MSSYSIYIRHSIARQMLFKGSMKQLIISGKYLEANKVVIILVVEFKCLRMAAATELLESKLKCYKVPLLFLFPTIC